MITIRLYPKSSMGLGSSIRFILRLLEIKDKVRLVRVAGDNKLLVNLKTIFLIPDSKLEIVENRNEIESISSIVGSVNIRMLSPTMTS